MLDDVDISIPGGAKCYSSEILRFIEPNSIW
jgi:hypothetical protein